MQGSVRFEDIWPLENRWRIALIARIDGLLPLVAVLHVHLQLGHADEGLAAFNAVQRRSHRNGRVGRLLVILQTIRATITLAALFT